MEERRLEVITWFMHIRAKVAYESIKLQLTSEQRKFLRNTVNHARTHSHWVRLSVIFNSNVIYAFIITAIKWEPMLDTHFNLILLDKDAIIFFFFKRTDVFWCLQFLIHFSGFFVAHLEINSSEVRSARSSLLIGLSFKLESINRISWVNNSQMHVHKETIKANTLNW